jgi:hypothetical protein
MTRNILDKEGEGNSGNKRKEGLEKPGKTDY